MEELISECGSIYKPGTANGTGTVSLISFDLDDPLGDIERQTILSNSGLVYANQQSLYIASIEDIYWAWLPVVEGDSVPRPGTTIHKFNIEDKPQYQASGRIDGYLINQFAMDEHDELLRVVTTDFAWWSDEEPKNSLFILQQNGEKLEQRSSLGGLGKPGERIFAARFTQDRGFLVTFQQIDPLYTLDLSDPDNPAVAGELEVPGVSTYLHPIDAGKIIAVGRNGSSVELSLFDTSDLYHPRLLHRVSIGNESYSEAEYNHKAFTWFADENLLALPFTRWTGSIDGPYYEYDLFNGLQVYRLDQLNGFEQVGEVDHSSFYQGEAEQRWYFPEPIRRSFFVADSEQNSFLYSISSRGIKVNDVEDLVTDLAALPLPYDSWPIIMSPETE
jgi:hypothetical protein